MHEIDIRNLDLNLLRVLHILLAERSVTRAARRLNLSQSATSHALGRLREFFDDPLLLRRQGRMHPTALAESLMTALEKIIADISMLAGPKTFSPATADARMRITMTPTAAADLVPGIIDRLDAQAPNLQVDFLQWNTNTLEGLHRGDIDMAIGIKKQINRQGLTQNYLYSDDFVCVVRKGHPLVGKRMDKESYQAWPHLLIDPTFPHARPLSQSLSSSGLLRRSRYTIQHLHAAHFAILNNDMIMTVSRTMARLFQLSADVDLLEPPEEIGEMPVFVAWHPRHDANPLHGWLRSLMFDMVGTKAA